MAKPTKRRWTVEVCRSCETPHDDDEHARACYGAGTDSVVVESVEPYVPTERQDRINERLAEERDRQREVEYREYMANHGDDYPAGSADWW